MTSSSSAFSAPSIAERVAEVRARIDAACHAAGRDPAGVTLTAVSKTQAPEAIDAETFGEQYKQALVAMIAYDF